MNKGKKQLIILSALLILCIGAYIFISVSNSNAEKKAAEEAAAALLYSPDNGSPVSLAITSGGETLSFVKNDAAWTYTGDPDFPLDQKFLTRITSSLTGLTAVRTLDMPQDLTDYGLNEPAHTLKVADADGNTFNLKIGAANGENTYAMVEGLDQVYTIPPTLAGYLDVELYDMITLDKITDVTEDALERITLTTEGMTLILDKHKEKDGSYTWFVVEGAVYTPAAEYVLKIESERSPSKYVSAVVKAVTSLQFTSCEKFKPTDAELSGFGLLPPALTVKVDYTVTVETYKKEDRSVTIYIGSELLKDGGEASEDGSEALEANSYYARLEGSDAVNVSSADVVAPLLDAVAAMGSPNQIG